ncbi:MAG TPA: LptA/OstA family protein [Rhizobiaceae bacterium]|nr:LptA/OstA family protein [Rhizobiaceae bacterium]
MAVRTLSRLCAGAGLALATFAAGAAFAQTSQTQMPGLQLSGNEPIQIESDKLEVRQNENIAIFSGNVTVVQGKTLLKSGKMTVFYAKGSGSATTGSANIDKLEVEDKVYVKSETQVATGDRGTFDMKKEVLVLTGKKVVLTDGPNVLVGCKLTVQMQSGEAQFVGCEGGGDASGRVIMSLTPGSANQPGTNRPPAQSQ